MKTVMVFDLDGTLAESKQPLDDEMVALLHRLLRRVKVAVISGASWLQFERQIFPILSEDANSANLVLLPTCGTKLVENSDGRWVQRYSEDFSAAQKEEIISSLLQAVGEADMMPRVQWGELIEDRESQITFSGLGQDAPLEQKRNWDPTFEKRKAIVELLRPRLPLLSMRIGGATSIDITRPGIDKAYGIRKLSEALGEDVRQMLFVGDALFPEGNDFPVLSTGISAVQVRDHAETKRVIETALAFLEPT